MDNGNAVNKTSGEMPDTSEWASQETELRRIRASGSSASPIMLPAVHCGRCVSVMNHDAKLCLRHVSSRLRLADCACSGYVREGERWGPGHARPFGPGITRPGHCRRRRRQQQQQLRGAGREGLGLGLGLGRRGAVAGRGLGFLLRARVLARPLHLNHPPPPPPGPQCDTDGRRCQKRCPDCRPGPADQKRRRRASRNIEPCRRVGRGRGRGRGPAP